MEQPFATPLAGTAALPLRDNSGKKNRMKRGGLRQTARNLLISHFPFSGRTLNS
jgi:hypothetical protein